MANRLRFESGVYIAMEEVNFFWTMQEVKMVEAGWRNGSSVWEIARKINRDPDEVAILVMDLIRKNLLRYRKGGAWGNEFRKRPKQE